MTTLAGHDDDGPPRFDLVPAPGMHVVRHAGRWVLVERAREYGTVNTSSGTPWEKLVLTAFGGDATLFPGLLEAARLAAGRVEHFFPREVEADRRGEFREDVSRRRRRRDVDMP